MYLLSSYSTLLMLQVLVTKYINYDLCLPTHFRLIKFCRPSNQYTFVHLGIHYIMIPVPVDLTEGFDPFDVEVWVVGGFFKPVA